MTGGEYLFNRMARSFGGAQVPYHLQPIQIREAMEDAYQDIRLKMFGAEGKEWAANAVIRRPSAKVEELQALAGRLADENKLLRERNEELLCEPRQIAAAPAPYPRERLFELEQLKKTIPQLQSVLDARNGEISCLKAELAVERRELRQSVEIKGPDEKPSVKPKKTKKGRARRLLQYMKGRAFE